VTGSKRPCIDYPPVVQQYPAELLTDLIQLRRPIREIAPLVEALPILPADIVELSARDVANVLEKFLAGEISGEEVGMRASALDFRMFDTVRVPDEDVGDIVQQLAMEADIEGRVWEHHGDNHLTALRAIISGTN